MVGGGWGSGLSDEEIKLYLSAWDSVGYVYIEMELVESCAQGSEGHLLKQVSLAKSNYKEQRKLIADGGDLPSSNRSVEAIKQFAYSYLRVIKLYEEALDFKTYGNKKLLII